jgi:hypothetical protein
MRGFGVNFFIFMFQKYFKKIKRNFFKKLIFFNMFKLFEYADFKNNFKKIKNILFYYIFK